MVHWLDDFLDDLDESPGTADAKGVLDRSNLDYLGTTRASTRRGPSKLPRQSGRLQAVDRKQACCVTLRPPPAGPGAHDRGITMTRSPF